MLVAQQTEADLNLSFLFTKWNFVPITTKMCNEKNCNKTTSSTLGDNAL